MAQDLVTLYNLALSAVGTRGRISSPDEESREGQLCRQWYPTVRDIALRAAHWPSCRHVTSLSLQAESSNAGSWIEGEPEPPWLFRFHLPVDFLYPRWLTLYEPFTLTQFENVVKLLTNSEDPILVYTKRQDIPAAWDVDLYNAIVMALAGSIAMPLHGKADRARNALEEANYAITRARVNQANQDYNPQESIPDWLSARGVTQQSSWSQFIYNFGPLFNTTALA
jgi:hypothetical protein